MNTSASDSSQLGPSGLQVELGAKPKVHSARFWLVLLSGALGAALLVIVGAIVLRGETPTTELALSPTALPASTIDLSSGHLFLHGSGNATNPRHGVWISKRRISFHFKNGTRSPIFWAAGAAARGVAR